MFFIAGITGKVGGAAARYLVEKGHQIRTVAREPANASEWSRAGVDVRRGDFNDAAAIAQALAGVEGAFLLLPPEFSPAPGFAKAKAIVDSFLEALHRVPPPRLVVLSSVGSEKSSDLGNITSTHLLEDALRNVTFPIAFLRAGSFIENHAFAFETAASTGIFDTYLTPTDRPVPMVATADIGSEAGRLLIGGWVGRKIIELGSRRSPDDLARAMSEVLGKPIKARAIPRENWSRTLQSQGMLPGTTGAFEEMEDSFNSGWIDFGVSGTESIAGEISPALVFEQMRNRRGS